MMAADGHQADLPDLGDLKSSLPFVEWPAVPTHTDALALSIARVFEASQWWPADKLLAAQMRQFQAIATDARDTIAFYADRLGALDTITGPLDPANIRALPILTRRELQEAGDALLRPVEEPAFGPVIRFRTSGSTGMPVRVAWTTYANCFVAAKNLRYHLWHRSDPAGKLVSLRALGVESDGRSRDVRGREWFPVFRSGENAAQNAAQPIADQLRWLVDEAPRYLLTYPSNARALLRHARETGISLPSLERIDTFGETFVDGLRELADAVWGVRVVDKYSAREVGEIAVQCPDGDGYHIQAETVYVEVIKPDGTPAETGEIGEVVVTGLHNTAMPLIRYAIGDYAEVGGPCSCGRGLPTLRRILGRTRNMLTLPSGDTLWPRYNSDDLNKAPISQFQLIQKSLDHIEVKVVPTRPLTEQDEAYLKAIIWELIPRSFRLTVRSVADIPRSAGGKYEDFKSELNL